MFGAEQFLHQLARMGAPNIVGCAVFGVILVAAMWPFTAIEIVDSPVDLGDYAGKYVMRRDKSKSAWPQPPGALCRFSPGPGNRVHQENSRSKNRRHGVPLIILSGFMRCNEDLIREHGLDGSPTFVYHSSKGYIAQCKIRRYNSPISTYEPGLYGATFRRECWLTDFVSEEGQVTEVWLEEILQPAPISAQPRKLP